MTPHEKLKEWKPYILLIGYDSNGVFKSSLCSGREDLSVAIKGYSEFRLFFLRESEREMDYWVNKASIYEKQINNQKQ